MMNKDDIFKEFMVRIGVNTPWSVMDDIVTSDANILRPVKGAAFEVLFDGVVHKYFRCEIKPGPGGDTDIDRVFNNRKETFTLQLKTCVTKTIIENVKFSVSLHKTHGEERRPRNLYPVEWPCPHCPHDGELFPDFLVVLHPYKGVLIVPREQIPRYDNRHKYKGHYKDPANFKWNSQWLNRWDLLGFQQFKGQSLERRSIPPQEKFTHLSQIIHLTDYEIVNMLLMPENFRVLEMNLKGNLREPSMVDWLKNAGIDTSKPEASYAKYDRVTRKGTKIQIKGPSKHLCNPAINQVGVEVMGSHGKGSPRRYSESDFDYLGFVIDPQIISDNINLDKSKYHYCLIPVSDLPLHYKNSLWRTINKLYENCKFVIDSDKNGYFLKPYTNYRNPVTFRGRGPWYVDKIPEKI